ncbi:immunity 24 family protein [Burkholderia humptydooensis]|nr:immunity 24 family protein [Burkholderia sp. 2002721687]
MHFFFHEVKDTSCPVFINGLVHDKFMSNGADVEMNYAWHWVDKGELAPLPEELWLITKDRSYSFDFRRAFNGYIISNRLLSLMDKYGTAGWDRAVLHVVNKKEEPISKLDYYFLRISDGRVLSDVIDLSESNVEFRRNGDIKTISHLVLSDEIDAEIFMVNDLALLGVLFCSAYFKLEFDKNVWKGVELIPENKFGVAKQLWDQ